MRTTLRANARWDYLRYWKRSFEGFTSNFSSKPHLFYFPSYRHPLSLTCHLLNELEWNFSSPPDSYLTQARRLLMWWKISEVCTYAWPGGNSQLIESFQTFHFTRLQISLIQIFTILHSFPCSLSHSSPAVMFHDLWLLFATFRNLIASRFHKLL